MQLWEMKKNDFLLTVDIRSREGSFSVIILRDDVDGTRRIIVNIKEGYHSVVLQNEIKPVSSLSIHNSTE